MPETNEQPTAPKLPSQGGSYVRTDDDSLERVAFTKPNRGALATEPGAEPADTTPQE